jgi:hypothetical protein
MALAVVTWPTGLVGPLLRIPTVIQLSLFSQELLVMEYLPQIDASPRPQSCTVPDHQHHALPLSPDEAIIGPAVKALHPPASAPPIEADSTQPFPDDDQSR